MAGEKTFLGTGGLAKQIVDSPDADGIISVESEKRGIWRNIRSAKVAGRIAEPAFCIPDEAVEALGNTGGKGKTQLVHKGTVHPVGAEGKDAVVIKNYAEPAFST